MHLLFNMFALYVLGTMLEPAIGTARFVALYFVSLLAGSFGALPLTGATEVTVGASGAIFGLLAAAFVIARGRGLDQLAVQIGLCLVINLALTFSDPRDQHRRPPRRARRRRDLRAGDRRRRRGMLGARAPTAELASGGRRRVVSSPARSPSSACSCSRMALERRLDLSRRRSASRRRSSTERRITSR